MLEAPIRALDLELEFFNRIDFNRTFVRDRNRRLLCGKVAGGDICNQAAALTCDCGPHDTQALAFFDKDGRSQEAALLLVTEQAGAEIDR